LLACELVDAELLDDLKNVNLLTQLALCALVKEIFSLFLRPAAVAAIAVESQQVPEAFIFVGESLTLLDLFLHLLFLVIFANLLRSFFHFLLQKG